MMNNTPETILIFAIFVLLVLQLVAITILVRLFGSKHVEKTVERIGALLAAQTDQQTVTLAEKVEAGTKAADAAFEEAKGGTGGTS